MRQVREMTDEKRLAFVEEYLASQKMHLRKKKVFLSIVFQIGFVPLQSKTNLYCPHR